MYGGRGGFGGVGRGGGRFGGGGRSGETLSDDPDDERFRKLFIAGLSYDTTDETLTEYFRQFGEVEKAKTVVDNNTKKSKGYAFVTFTSPDAVDLAQSKRPHTIDGRSVETKRPMPKDESKESVKKVFIGGCNKDTDEESVRELFKEYGNIEQIDVIKDKQTGNFKGYCFVTFDDTDSVDKCVVKRRFRLNGKMVDVKKAQNKEAGGGGGRGRGRGGYQGGGYGGGGGYGYGYGDGYGYDGYGGYGQGGYDGYNEGYGNGYGSNYGGQGAFGSNYGDNYYGGAMKGGSYNRSQPYNTGRY